MRDSANQRNTIIASIDVVPADGGCELIVQVNSEERAQEIDGLIDAWFPDAEVRSDDLLDLDEVRPPGETASVDDSVMRQALEQHIAAYEAQWLDDHIPALGGRTPREAVQDPIGREDVIHLLASFPEPPKAPPP